MELFKAQEIALSLSIFRNGVRRITVKDVEDINTLLSQYPGRFPPKVAFIDEHMRYAETDEYYLYFVRVFNAAVFIKQQRLAGRGEKKKEISSLIRRLNDITDISGHHLVNIALHFKRSAKRDFLLL